MDSAEDAAAAEQDAVGPRGVGAPAAVGEHEAAAGEEQRRSGGAGGRLMLGVVIGLAYYLASETLANSGQVFNLNPAIVNWLPLFVLCAITVIALARIR